MKGVLVVAVVVAVVSTACGSTKTVTKTVTVVGTTASDLGSPRVSVLYGQIKSLTRKGQGFELRFDPAWFLMGETANVAAAEDGAVAPGEPVPNDNYRLDEGHRLLTYVVPANARVTVLKDSPDGKPSTVAELAQLVAGKNPFSRPLFEPLRTGFWIRVRIDTVRSLDQQYIP